MSYSSTNELAQGTRLKDVTEFASLLGYRYTGALKSDEVGTISCFNWFEEKDYCSWSGIELQLVAQRRIDFLERQLSEFYAPLAGMRKQIRAKSEVRQKVSAAANAAWQEICQSYGDRMMHDHEQRFVPFKKIFEYENEQLKSELVPMYCQMLTLFTEKYHLAGPDTRAFYQEFLEFVEIWNRSLANSLPGEVIEKLDHNEDKVKAFYEHLESKMQELQSKIAEG